MSLSEIIKKYEQWLDRIEPAINTYANHLIVIFAFSVPVLTEARRTSLVLLLVLLLVRGRIFNYARIALRDPVVMSFTVYFMLHIVWMTGTDDLDRVGEVVHDAAFLLIPLLFSMFISSDFVNRILVAFLAGMLVSVTISFGIYLELIPPMIHDGSQGDWKDPTPMYHHSHYGYMLALTSVVLLQRAVSQNYSSSYRVVAAILMAAVTVNIFIIAGRSGYVIVLTLLPVLLLLVYGKNALKPLLTVLVVVSVATVIAYQYSVTFKLRMDTSKESIEKIIHDKDYHSSLGGRMVIANHALTLASDNWLLGMGTADHTGAIQKKIQQENSDLTFISTFLAHPHNEYLNAILQFGILGLIAFLNIPFQLMRYKNEDNDKQIMFKLLGLSILLYTLLDVMVIDLGMMFTVVVLVASGLRSYPVSNARFSKFNLKLGGVYFTVMLLFYLAKQI
jgi:O-antigen ligase